MFHNENFVRKTEKREHERSIPFYTPLLYFLASFPAFATEKEKLEKQPVKKISSHDLEATRLLLRLWSNLR